ncbi:tetratricopeptide repeat protein [Amphritea pacifica]|uniref:tetratricopeptide repeat protein n=1 Tax=Amphritea pacifica TaxID=2811233 RepID=UPI0019667B3F|nr:tetratricopeptide repeat protein [Amphritea pacifica]MBN1008012.1 tetratricopeptide repeat protein [Amphritea pacifica]
MSEQSQTTVDNVAALLTTIDKQRADGQFSEAKATLEHALIINPKHTGLRYRDALLNQQSGDLQLAEFKLRQLIIDQPEFFWAKVQLLNILMQADKLESNDENHHLAQAVLTKDPLNQSALKATLTLAILNRNALEIQTTLQIALTHHQGYPFVNICTKYLSKAEAITVFKNCENTDNPALWHRLAELYIQSESRDEALPLLQRILEIEPTHEPAHRMLLSSLLFLKRYTELDEHIAKAELLISESEFVARIKASSLHKQGRFIEALGITRKLIETPKPSEASKNLHGWLLLSIDKANEYQPFLKKLNNNENNIIKSHLQYRLGFFSESLQSAELAYQQDPRTLDIYIQRLKLLGQTEKITEILKQSISEKDCQLFHELLILNYAQSGQLDNCIKAIEDFESMFEYDQSALNILFSACITLRSDLGKLEIFRQQYEKQPENSQAFIRYLDILRIMGRHKEANQHDRLVAQNHVPDQLPSANIQENIDNIEAPSQPVPINNAWFAWLLANQSTESFDAWYKRAHWGVQANTLIQGTFIQDCQSYTPKWCNYPIDPINLNLIDRLLTKGRGLIAVSSHHGPSVCSIIQLHRNNYPLSVVASTGRELKPQLETIFLTANPTSELRQLSKRLNHNEILVTAPDMSRGKEGISFNFLRGTLTLSTLLPRLAYRRGTPLVWMQARWTQNNRIHIDLQELPSPKQNQSEDDFIQCWATAYLSLLEEHLCGDPANLSFMDEWKQWVWKPKS